MGRGHGSTLLHAARTLILNQRRRVLPRREDAGVLRSRGQHPPLGRLAGWPSSFPQFFLSRVRPGPSRDGVVIRSLRPSRHGPRPFNREAGHILVHVARANNQPALALVSSMNLRMDEAGIDSLFHNRARSEWDSKRTRQRSGHRAHRRALRESSGILQARSLTADQSAFGAI